MAPQIQLPQALSPTEIFVQWDKISEEDTNGIITVYEVDYTYPGGPQLQCNESSESVTLVNLAEAETYGIRVRAYTSVGHGPYGGVMQVTTPDARKL